MVAREDIIAEISARAITDTSRRPRAFLLYGGPGLGKTTVLHELQYRCQRAGVATGFIHGALSGGDGAGLLARISALAPRSVLFVDALEELDLGHRELIEAAVAHVPHQALLVASRGGPPPTHRGSTDLELIELAPLSLEASHQLLREHDVPADQLDLIAEVAAGNPLLLEEAAAAVCEAGRALPRLELERMLDHALVHRVWSPALDGDHRAAIDLAAVVPIVGRELFEHVLTALRPGARNDQLFTWLAARGFASNTYQGLRMDDQVRAAWLAIAETERRPTLHELRKVVREFYTTRLQQGFGWAEARAALLCVDDSATSLRPHAVDEEDALDPIRFHEGAATGAAAAFAADESVFELYRDSHDKPVALLGIFELPRHERALRHAADAGDPVLARVRDFLDGEGTLAPHESALVIRWCLTTRGGNNGAHRLHPIRNRIGRRILRARALAYTIKVFDADEPIYPFDAPVTVRRFALGKVSLPACTLQITAHSWRRQCVQALVSAAVGGNDEVLAGTTTPDGRSIENIVQARLDAIANEAGLTPREQEVLHLLVLGRTAEEIAVALGVRPRTAKFHQSNILAKLGLESRLELFRMLL